MDESQKVKALNTLPIEKYEEAHQRGMKLLENVDIRNFYRKQIRLCGKRNIVDTIQAEPKDWLEWMQELGTRWKTADGGYPKVKNKKKDANKRPAQSYQPQGAASTYYDMFTAFQSDKYFLFSMIGQVRFSGKNSEASGGNTSTSEQAMANATNMYQKQTNHHNNGDMAQGHKPHLLQYQAAFSQQALTFQPPLLIEQHSVRQTVETVADRTDGAESGQPVTPLSLSVDPGLKLDIVDMYGVNQAIISQLYQMNTKIIDCENAVTQFPISEVTFDRCFGDCVAPCIKAYRAMSTNELANQRGMCAENFRYLGLSSDEDSKLELKPFIMARLIEDLKMGKDIMLIVVPGCVRKVLTFKDGMKALWHVQGGIFVPKHLFRIITQGSGSGDEEDDEDKEGEGGTMESER
jgi:hypothetical protein